MMSVVSAVASPLVLVDKGEDLYLHDQALKKKSFQMNAAVNGHLELTLLKVRQRFDAISKSNLEVYKFQDW